MGIGAEVRSAAAWLAKAAPFRPALALVLGTGFQNILAEREIITDIPYQELPGWPSTSVEGHAGRVVFARVGGEPVLILDGRAHYYEGHSMDHIGFAIRTLAAFGVRDLLLTNAAGAINPRFRPGDFMLLTDHINFMGTNPLRGSDFEISRFVDLTTTYDGRLGRLLRRAARDSGARLRSGVYLAVCGPSYETPAEIRAFARLGADAVGMSTVPEAIVARHCGLRVAAVSCITNRAANRHFGGLSHRVVLTAAKTASAAATRLLENFCRWYARDKCIGTDAARVGAEDLGGETVPNA